VAATSSEIDALSRDDIVATGVRQVAEVRDINRSLIEKALRMRILAYMSQVKATLLTDTIHEMKFSKLALRDEIKVRQQAEAELTKTQMQLEERVESRTAELRASNDQLRNEMEQRLQMEAQFLQAQKMEAVGTLAGGLAHEFNNLLMVVQGGIELGLASVPADGEAADSLRMVQEAAERASGLTAQLLTLSRRQESQKRPTDINDLVERVATLLQGSITKNIDVAVALAPNVPAIDTDAGLLHQALLNLGINARDAMPKGGRLSFETAVVDVDENNASARARAQTQAGRFFLIRVHDSGQGIPAENLARIFEPFYTTKAEGEGTGLGLAMVYGCVEGHGGWIDVESTVGQGTTFSLFLPLVAAE
jgi:signal transduction histidine kinase